MTNDEYTLDKLFPKTHKVVFLHAHCDDESFLSAGIMNQLDELGRDCYVIYGAAAIVDGQEKTVIRQEHTLKSLDLVGIKKVFFMEFTETKYADIGGYSLVNQKLEDVVNKLLSLLKDNKINAPFVLVSYDKNGGYGNVDHKIIYKLGREIKKIKSDIILYEITINRENMLNWIKGAKKRLPVDLLPLTSYWSKKFGTSYKEISFTYNLTNKQIKLKHMALAFHTFYNMTDIFPLALDKEDFRTVFGREYLKFVKS